MSKNTVLLTKPIMINNKKVSELSYDVDELSINSITNAEAMKYKLAGNSLAGAISLAQTDTLLHICIGFQAVLAINPDIAEEDLMRIKGKDLTSFAAVGQRFFIPKASVKQATSEMQQEDTQDTTVAQ